MTTLFYLFQTEIAKRLNAIIAQILPFLSQEHQQQVATAVDRAKQVTMTELNAIIGVSTMVSLVTRDGSLSSVRAKSVRGEAENP